jgi:hypothetical protein
MNRRSAARRHRSAFDLHNPQPSMGLEMLEGRNLFSVVPGFDDEPAALNEDDGGAIQATAATVAATPHQNHVNHLKHLAHDKHVNHDKSVKHGTHLVTVERQRHHRHHGAHVHRLHEHHVHHHHAMHRAHILRTTHPAPLVLTAQQRNDWATIREEVVANRPRVPN